MTSQQWMKCPDSLCENGRVRSRANVYGGDDPAGSMCHTCNGRGQVPVGAGGHDAELGCIGRLIANVIAVFIVLGVIATAIAIIAGFATGGIQDFVADVRGEGPSIEETAVVPAAEEWAIGTCLGDAADRATVACEAPHWAEVTYVADVRYGEDDGFPGDGRMTEFLFDLCGFHFDQYVTTPDKTPFTFTALGPTQQQWADGNRRIYCLVRRADGASPPTITGSVGG